MKKLLGLLGKAGAAAPVVPAGPFAPSDLANLALWLKADALALSNNDPVSSWTDSSGNAKHAVQATGSKQPLFKTAVLTGYEGQVATPRPVVRFDGTDDFLLTPAIDLSGGKTATLFVVCGNITAGSQYSILETSANYAANSGGIRLTRESTNTLKTWVWTTGGAATGATWATTATLSTLYASFSAYFDTTQASTSGHREGKTEGWINDGQRQGSQLNDTGVTGNLGNLAMYLGSRAGTSLFLAGDIAEVILYSRRLTHRDRGRVTLYLRDKYDIFA